MGTPITSAVMRNRGRCQSAFVRVASCARVVLDGDNPVMPHVQGQFLGQPVNERRTALVQNDTNPMVRSCA